MLRRILTLISICFVAAISAEKNEKLDNIQKSLDKILSKAGIQFNGEFRSQYLPSKIEGSAINDTADRQIESNEFTSVDFDITARPNSMVGARVIFRLHQNWQNFYADVSNPIFSRWISIDGNVKDMIAFHAGDFKEKYSPLTLYSPDIEILNEPYIFARQRQIAVDELFIGNNNRVLQGVNLKFDAEVYPIFNEFHVGLIGSRLRSTDVYGTNGNYSVPANQVYNISKYFIGGNLDLTFLKGINFGFTDLFIFDQKASYRGSDTTADTIAQRTNIFSLRPGVEIGKMISSEIFTLDLNTELAFSSDDSTSFDSVGVTTTNTIIKEFRTTSINGSAINIGLNAGLNPNDIWGLNLNASFIMNSKDFRNELAQSPSFIGTRIMNLENCVKDSGKLYNTFDALYHSVFKFAPPLAWSKSPFMKTSYDRSIKTQNELAEFVVTKADDALQLIMPFGPATPNRTGIKGNIQAKFFKEGIKIDAIYASLNEAEEEKLTKTIKIPKTSFTQFGGGLKIDLSKMISVFENPLEISGSYVMTTAKRSALDTILQKYEVQSNFINIGLYYKFLKRMALLGGYQGISNTYEEGKTTEEVNFGNWSAGLEWKVMDGADVVTTVGQMTKKNPDKIGDVAQTIADIMLRVKF